MDSALTPLEKQEVLDWLCKTDYVRIHKDISTKRAFNTGDWFLESTEVQRWMHGSDKQILWCPGMPGVGKTVLSSLVIDHLELHEDAPTCVIYLNYKRHSIQTSSHILSSILRQICSSGSDNVSLGPISKLWRAHSSSKSYPSEDELRATLSETMSASERVVYLVLDALDEYSSSYSDELVTSLLRDLSAINTEKFRIMVTSRTLGRMESVFEDLGAIRREIVSSSEDIAQYLHHRIITELPFVGNHEADVVERITQYAMGRFLLAHLHMNSLSNLLTLKEIEDCLNRLSGKIDLAYQDVMERVNRQDESKKDLANRVLLWITCTKENLSVKELQYALAIAPGRKRLREHLDSVDTITAVCAGLVVVDQENDVIRFIHETAQEFFESICKTRFPSPDRVILDSFLTYLSECMPWDLAPMKRLKPGPLLLYISHWWIFHLQQCQQGIFPTIAEFTARQQSILHAVRLSQVTRSKNDDQTPTPINVLYDLHLSGDLSSHSSARGILIAAALNLTHLLRLFLEDGVDPNTRPLQSGAPPLSLAVRCSALDTAKLLLQDSRVDINLRDSAGRSPLSWAIMEGAERSIQLLLNEPKVDINLPDHRLDTPLIHAVRRGSASIVEHLLRRDDIEVNAQNVSGSTALMVALTSLNSDAVVYSLLIDRRLDISKLNNNGQTIFDILSSSSTYCQRLRPRTLMKLHELFRDQFKEYTGESLIGLLIQAAYTSAVAEIVKHFPDDVDMPNTRQQTPLARAAQKGLHDVSSLLIDLGNANVHSRDVDGRTPLMEAAQWGHLSIVEQLLNEEAGLNVMDNQGRTALSLTTLNPRRTTTTIARRLLEAGADVELVDNDERSPLSLASEYATRELVEILVEHGANVNSIDVNGRTPLYYAANSVPKCFICSDRSRRNIALRHNAPCLPEVGAKLELVRFLLREGALSYFISGEDCGQQIRSPNHHINGEIEEQHRTLTERSRLNAQDSLGRTELMTAALRGDMANVTTFLDSPDTLVNTEDSEGKTALSLAISYMPSSTQIPQKLLEFGADPNFPDNTGRTPLSYAAELGTLQTVELLLERSANPDLVDFNLRAPLYYAASNARCDCMEEKDAPSVEDGDECVALEIMKLLLKRTSNPMAKDGEETAFLDRVRMLGIHTTEIEEYMETLESCNWEMEGYDV